MIAAFDRSGASGAHESAERLTRRLDEFGAEWLEMRAEVCRATKVSKQQPEDVLRLRNDCLDRQRTDFRSLTPMLTNADVAVVSRATEVAYGLPQTSWCADVPTLRASAGLPDDPAKRQKVLEVRKKLADAESRALAGRLKEAEALAADAVTLARSTDHAPTTAEALLYAGQTLRWEGEFAASVPLMREAVFLASASGVDSVTVRAATALAFVTGPKLQHAEEPRIWLDMARAALRRMGGNEELELDVMEREALLLMEVGVASGLALPIDEKIIAAYRRLYGVHPKTETALYNAGVAHIYLGEPALARPYFEEARAMDESTGGPLYSAVGQSEYMLGWTLASLGDLRGADTLLRRAIAIFDQNGMDYWSALAFHVRSWAALAAGDVPAAVTHGEKALALLATAKSPERPRADRERHRLPRAHPCRKGA